MSNDTGLRNIKALSDQRRDRTASEYAREHIGQAQVLGREINELVREHKDYLKILERFDFKILDAAKPIIAGAGFRGSIEEQAARQQKAQETLTDTFTKAAAKLNEMHARLATIAVGINALRG